MYDVRTAGQGNKTAFVCTKDSTEMQAVAQYAQACLQLGLKRILTERSHACCLSQAGVSGSQKRISDGDCSKAHPLFPLAVLLFLNGSELVLLLF